MNNVLSRSMLNYPEKDAHSTYADDARVLDFAILYRIAHLLHTSASIVNECILFPRLAQDSPS